MKLPCCCSKGSNSSYSLHIFSIPPDALLNYSFPSKESIISCFSFLHICITFIRSLIATTIWCSSPLLYCSTNHCCFNIVEISAVSILPRHGRYAVIIVVLLLFFPRSLKMSTFLFPMNLDLYLLLQKRIYPLLPLSLLLVCFQNSKQG